MDNATFLTEFTLAEWPFLRRFLMTKIGLIGVLRLFHLLILYRLPIQLNHCLLYILNLFLSQCIFECLLEVLSENLGRTDH